MNEAGNWKNHSSLIVKPVKRCPGELGPVPASTILIPES